MKSNRWHIKEKEIALGTALELVKVPPFVPQITRYFKGLKASFCGLFRTNLWELNFSRTKIVQDLILELTFLLLLLVSHLRLSQRINDPVVG